MSANSNGWRASFCKLAEQGKRVEQFVTLNVSSERECQKASKSVLTLDPAGSAKWPENLKYVYKCVCVPLWEYMSLCNVCMCVCVCVGVYMCAYAQVCLCVPVSMCMCLKSSPFLGLKHQLVTHGFVELFL